MPYTSPEAFKDSRSSTRHDIFAFGMIIYEMIFDTYPLEYRRAKLKTLESHYKKQTIKILLDVHFFRENGPAALMEVLLTVVEKCTDNIYLGLSPTPDKRPYIDWLVIFFR